MSSGPTATSSAKSGSNEETEEVTEETICVEFCAAIDSQLFNSNLNSIKFLGLDTNQVMLQMCGNTFFCGQMEHIFGTNVLFEVKPQNQKTSDKDKDKDKDIESEDKKGNKSLNYIGKCDKKLVMKRVFLESKQNQSIDSSQMTTNDNKLI